MKYLLFLTLPLYVLDQASKAWITGRFPEPGELPHERIEVVPGFFDLVRVHNTGMAFGLGNGTSWSNAIFLSIAALAIGFIVYLWRKGMLEGITGHVAAALLISGILGNVTDRLARGYVVDFLDFSIGDKHWPSFNVADSCICVAAGLLILGSFAPVASTTKEGSSRG
ncbi:MAG: signal peptidase II [Verrucomicrobia bacterium]|jgi:signal peptidase II|nr:MAG: signal peptidase II [Verrucomicrobiota bacterium]